MAENDEIITYIKRAFELKNQESYKQAIEMLYKAIAIEPDNIEIMFQIGELYYLLGNYSRAIQYPEQILSKDENHLQAMKLLKNIYLQQNELFSAKEYAEKIYAQESSENNLAELIEIYGKLELPDEIEKYRDNIENSEKCLYAYAKALFDNSNPDKAEEICGKVLLLNPDNEDCKILMGKILFNKNETEKAREIFLGFPHSKNPEILNFQGLFALEDLNYIDAIKAFSQASNLDKNNSVYSYNLGNAYFLNGWYDEAVAAYKNAICLTPENNDYRYSLAYIYYEHGEFEKSRKEVEYILEGAANHAGAKVIKALLLYRDKNFIEAENILKSNIENGNADSFTLSSLAKIEAELGKYGNAETHITAALKITPDNLNYKCELGEILIKEKKPIEAVKLAEEIFQDNPNYIPACILGAKAAYEANDYDTAKDFASKALSIDINCAQGYYYLALVRMQEQDFDEAIECMKRAIIHDLENADYYAQMAMIYKQLGDIKSAFEYIKEAESIDPSEKYKILFREYATLNRK